DLALVFVAVRTAETNHCGSVAAGAPVHDRQRDQGISPRTIQVKCNLVVVLAWPLEVDLFRMVDERQSISVPAPWQPSSRISRFRSAYWTAAKNPACLRLGSRSECWKHGRRRKGDRRGTGAPHSG